MKNHMEIKDSSCGETKLYKPNIQIAHTVNITFLPIFRQFQMEF